MSPFSPCVVERYHGTMLMAVWLGLSRGLDGKSLVLRKKGESP